MEQQPHESNLGSDIADHPTQTNAPEFLGIDSQHSLVLLADELNYERAAEKLNITPSELKSRVRALEEVLCCSLFQGTPRKLRLTENGHILAHLCRRFIAYSEKSKAKAKAAGE